MGKQKVVYNQSFLVQLPTTKFEKAINDILNGKACYKLLNGDISDFKESEEDALYYTRQKKQGRCRRKMLRHSSK